MMVSMLGSSHSPYGRSRRGLHGFTNSDEYYKKFKNWSLDQLKNIIGNKNVSNEESEAAKELYDKKLKEAEDQNKMLKYGLIGVAALAAISFLK